MKVFFSMKLRSFEALKPGDDSPMSIVGKDGKPVDGLLGFVAVFDSEENAKTFDETGEVLEGEVMEDP